MASPTGLVGGQVLNGVDLTDACLNGFETRLRDVGRAVVENATGDLRQGLHYLGAARELVKRKYDHTLRYDRLPADGVIHDLIEEQLAGPGPHDLVSWKTVHLQYIGNGTRKEFELPRYVATHFYTPPSVLPSTRFDPAIRVEGAATLTVTTVDEATFEAGYPGAGVAWLLDEGLLFRLTAAPAANVIVHVRYCPVFSCFAADQTAKQYQGATPMREPRDIELRER